MEQSTEPTRPVPRDDADAEHARQAAIIGHLAAPAYLAAALEPHLGRHVQAPGVKVYLDCVKRRSGESTDPVETMLLEALVLSHHVAGAVIAQGAKSDVVEHSSIYLESGRQLMSEFRRLALALQEYRLASRRLAADALSEEKTTRSKLKKAAHAERAS